MLPINELKNQNVENKLMPNTMKTEFLVIVDEYDCKKMDSVIVTNDRVPVSMWEEGLEMTIDGTLSIGKHIFGVV